MKRKFCCFKGPEQEKGKKNDTANNQQWTLKGRKKYDINDQNSIKWELKLG